MPTEKMLLYFTAQKQNHQLNPTRFESVYNEVTLYGCRLYIEKDYLT